MRWRSARTGRASTSPRRQQAVVRLNRNTTTGAITQPAGRAGCISETGIGQCADGHATRSGARVAVSPDGKSVYVASSDDDAVVRLNRNTTTGAITQPAGTAGCISETGAGPCANGHGLDGPSSVAVSRGRKECLRRLALAATPWRTSSATRPPGRSPSPPGAAGCISETGAGPCADGHALTVPDSVALSADGKSVYVASFGSDAVVRLNRNTTTGGDHPARRERRLHQRHVWGGALRRRPRALRPRLGGGQRRRKERLRRLRFRQRRPQRRRRGALHPQHDHRGDHPARRDRRLHQRDGVARRGPAPTAMGSCPRARWP